LLVRSYLSILHVIKRSLKILQRQSLDLKSVLCFLKVTYFRPGNLIAQLRENKRFVRDNFRNRLAILQEILDLKCKQLQVKVTYVHTNNHLCFHLQMILARQQYFCGFETVLCLRKLTLTEEMAAQIDTVTTPFFGQVVVCLKLLVQVCSREHHRLVYLV
jgi:hypothetical protein